MSRSANSSFWRFDLQFALHALNLGHVEDIVRPVAVRRWFEQEAPHNFAHPK
jgi:hypothetical protein